MGIAWFFRLGTLTLVLTLFVVVVVVVVFCCFLLLLLLFFVVVVKAAVWRKVQFILFYFANYSPSITMELKVGKEITCKWQDQRLETNKYVLWALFLKLQTLKNCWAEQFSKTLKNDIEIALKFLLRYFNLPLTL